MGANFLTYIFQTIGSIEG